MPLFWALLACLSQIGFAQTKVVVIPMGDDDPNRCFILGKPAECVADGEVTVPIGLEFICDTDSGKAEEIFYKQAFQFVELCDELQFTITNDSLISRSAGNINIPPEQDLCIRAAKALQAFANVSHGVEIQLNKKIPMGGGLGGASSDAATTLLVLNKLWNVEASEQQLLSLAKSLGADIPVFIKGQAAWAEGIGEQLTPLDIEEYWYLIIDPKIHVSTAEMFAHSQLTRNCPQLTICPPKPGEFGNVFEPIVRAQHPKIHSMFSWLNDHHASPFLTGTGGCVVAAFENKDDALEVQSQRPDGINAYLALGRNISPLVAQLQAI